MIFVLLDDRKREGNTPRHFTEHKKEYFKKMNKDGWGVFWAVNKFKGGRRVKEKLERLNFAYCDLDLAKEGESVDIESLQSSKLALSKALKEKCEPTHIIETKNGLQPLWRLVDGLPEKVDEYVLLLKGIVKWTVEQGGYGDNVYDVSRIVRLPGYDHMKSEPFPVKEIHRSNKIYTIERMREIFPFQEEIKEHKPVNIHKLSPIDQAIQNLDIEDVAIRAFSQVGRQAFFDKQHRLVLDGRLTGTHRGKKETGDNNFLASNSHEPFVGNVITLPAMIFGITNKEAREWIIKEYNLVWKDEKIKQLVKKIENQPVKITEDTKRYTWGTQNLNYSFGIIKRNSFIVFGARGGNGKTTFTFDMAIKNARLGHNVLYLGLEVTKGEILDGLARRKAGITIEEEYENTIPENKQKRYDNFIDEVSKIDTLNFYGIFDKELSTWGVCREIILKGNYDLVIIDNLDKIGHTESKNDWERQKFITSEMANFTNKEKIPIILIHHHRKGSTTGNIGDDLSGSHKIRDNADYVVQIKRVGDADSNYPERYESEITLEKARNYDPCVRSVYFIKGEFVDTPPDLKDYDYSEYLSLLAFNDPKHETYRRTNTTQDNLPKM